MPRECKYVRERPERSYTYATTLAIDWGSEGVRSKLYYNMGDVQPVDKLLQHIPIIKDMHLERQEVKRQFSSHIYPFDNTSPIYPGNNRLPGSRSISSKLGMYAVVGISDEVSRQSPQLEELRAEVLRKPMLKKTIRIGIEQMMYCILYKVYESLGLTQEGSPRTIDAIALTIPAQWTIEFEEEYGELLNSAWARVFKSDAPQLIILSEGQTNAHYAFYQDTFAASHDRQHLSQQNLFDIGKSKNGVLLIDAGGHSTNTSLVTICRDNNQLEIRPDRGAIGGTALWAWHVLQLLKTSWEQMHPSKVMPVEIENQILKTFYLHCPEYRDDTGAPFDIYSHGPNRDNFHRLLSPEELVQMFEDAHAYAFSLIEEGIRELKALARSCERIKIVIGGGSAQGAMWVARISSLCSKHQMEEPIYLWQIDQIYEYARLAAGANYALAKAKSVAQFVGGAAFGLTVKKRFRGADGWTTDWHYQATMLWARGNKWAKTITADGVEEFKIICQPEYDNPRPTSFIEPNYKAYDLLPIPCHKKGTLQFDLEINTETEKLKLKVKHRELSKSGKLGRSTETREVEFDLWVPPGSRCLQIWDPVEDIDSRVTTSFAQWPSPNEGAEGDQPEEMEIDSVAAERPVQRAHSLRRSLRHSPSQAQQAAAAVYAQDDGSDLLMAAPFLSAQPGVPQAPTEDIERSGMEDAEEVADSITAAAMPEEPPNGYEGQAAPHRRSRRGSRVATGIFAL